MKVAMTGDTPVSREELVARSVAAGLNTLTSVSGQTSVVVTGDPVAGSAKLKRAANEGAPLVDEPAYLRLLSGVQSARPRALHGSIARSRRPRARPLYCLRRRRVYRHSGLLHRPHPLLRWTSR
ncbi:hypothetical protein [Streptomyces sp. NPDC018045]|uniref:hypothetical protein n=1 Tax=Streptomyces sp. NPDC018045 TaxID=3365037 RepID=UPI0037AA8D6F